MRRPHRSLVFWSVVAIALATMATPRPAYACVWKIQDLFKILPACKVEDQFDLKRIRQGNAYLGAKLLTIAEKINLVQQEVYGWQRAYQSAATFEERLRTVYGDLTASPLPSLVDGYQTTKLAAYVRLQPNGSFGVSLTPVDLRHVVDSVRDAFTDAANINKLYRTSWLPEERALDHEVYGSGVRLQRSLTRLARWERYTNSILDSLQANGYRTASRYEGHTLTDGLAEAKIANTSASLTRSRATAFELQVLGIHARIQVLNAETARAREVHDYWTHQTAFSNY